MAELDPLVLSSARGGLNNTDPAIAIENNACTVAEDVEFVNSMLGERRKGCVPIELPASVTGNTALTAVTWAFRHLPGSDEANAELWLLAQSLTTSDNLIVRRTKSGWSTITPTDAPITTNWEGHSFAGQSLHMKLFLSYKSAVDRFHVFDGTTLRPAGLAEPAAPAVTDTAAAGTYASARYVRIRYITISSGDILRRSEPSDATTFTPLGTKTGAIVTRPALLGEGETHWEIEFGADGTDGDFYVVATLAVGTTTYTDTTAYASASTYTFGDLSEDPGRYTLIPSGRFVCADEDRLLVAGSREDESYASSIWWTPPAADPGVGNDERIDDSITSRADLDDGAGGLTGMVQAGNIYAFKLSRVYQLRRTNSTDRAYEPKQLTDKLGAVKGSIVTAIDEQGRPCVYFTDPHQGPYRLSVNGFERCGFDVLTTWKTRNVDAPIPIHGVYYADSQQIKYWVALNGASYPNTVLTAQTNHMTQGKNGIRGGWSTIPAGRRIADAHCSCLFSTNVDSTDNRSLALVPFIGKQAWTVNGTAVRNLVQRCDVGTTDAAVDGDDLAVYRGRVRAKPFILLGLLTDAEITTGSVLAQPAAGVSFQIRLVRNFSDNESDCKQTSVELTPSPRYNQRAIIYDTDDLRLSELRALEVEYGDLDETVTPSGVWAVDRLEFRLVPGIQR